MAIKRKTKRVKAGAKRKARKAPRTAAANPTAEADKRLQALERLTGAGSSSPQQMSRRFVWLQEEWRLPPCPKIGRTMTTELLDYCKKHSVSLDWLLCGELKELRSMMDKRKACGNVAAPETDDSPIVVDFIRTFRQSVLRGMNQGKDVWQVLDEMEAQATRVQKS